MDDSCPVSALDASLAEALVRAMAEAADTTEEPDGIDSSEELNRM